MRGLIDTMDTLITGPTVAPLDLDEVKKHRRFSSTTLDTLFDLWINAAVQYYEGDTGTQLITATWEYWLDRFPCHRDLEIPHPPLQSVPSIKYDDVDGNEQTIDPSQYRVLAPNGGSRGFVSLKPGFTWPCTACQSMAVRVRFIAGFGNAPGDIDELTKYALMMLVGHFHKFGEEVNEARANILLLPIGASGIIETAKYLALPRLPPRAFDGSGSVSPWFGTGMSWR